MLTKETIEKALAKCIDPELHMDIVTLELVYNISFTERGEVTIEMTFTSPMCPYGPALVQDVEEKLHEIPEVKEVQVKLVFEPPWKPSEELKAVLGIN